MYTNIKVHYIYRDNINDVIIYNHATILIFIVLLMLPININFNTIIIQHFIVREKKKL